MIVTSLVSCDQLTGLLNGLIPDSGTGDQGGDDPNKDDPSKDDPSKDEPLEHVDYVSQLKLDMNSETLKQEVTIKMHVDGDTTHFYVPTSVMSRGYIKARYLAINTPESTGKIEEWGKTASNFTKEKLYTAVSIIIESDTDEWNIDSTGDRHLLWVWYKPDADSDYRNLNLEILQNGLAIASNTAQNRYGDTCIKALNQAKAEKLHVFSDEKDPNFYYGKAQEMTLKELRCHIADYDGQKVAFEGVITRNYNDGVYVENYDEETGMYYGVYIYYGSSGVDYRLAKILESGNRVRIVGTVTYFEGGGTYQVSDPVYQRMKPNDPDNCKLIEEGHSPAYAEIAPGQFNEMVTLTFVDHNEETGEDVETQKEFKFGDLALDTTVSMKNLKVASTYTTESETDSNGAITITCTIDGQTVDIRTATPLKFADGTLVTADYFTGKTLDVQGVVDYYNGKYQIQIFSINDVTLH